MTRSTGKLTKVSIEKRGEVWHVVRERHPADRTGGGETATCLTLEDALSFILVHDFLEDWEKYEAEQDAMKAQLAASYAPDARGHPPISWTATSEGGFLLTSRESSGAVGYKTDAFPTLAEARAADEKPWYDKSNEQEPGEPLSRLPRSRYFLRDNLASWAKHESAAPSRDAYQQAISYLHRLSALRSATAATENALAIIAAYVDELERRKPYLSSDPLTNDAFVWGPHESRDLGDSLRLIDAFVWEALQFRHGAISAMIADYMTRTGAKIDEIMLKEYRLSSDNFTIGYCIERKKESL